eukprot:scaffold213_cov245-Pinguiococcus_pyrenoidosus.AAC.16
MEGLGITLGAILLITRRVPLPRLCKQGLENAQADEEDGQQGGCEVAEKALGGRHLSLESCTWQSQNGERPASEELDGDVAGGHDIIRLDRARLTTSISGVQRS